MSNSFSRSLVIAVIKAESIPPLKNIPRLTSSGILFFTDSKRCFFVADKHSLYLKDLFLLPLLSPKIGLTLFFFAQSILVISLFDLRVNLWPGVNWNIESENVFSDGI